MSVAAAPFSVSCKGRDLVRRVRCIRNALSSSQVDQLSALMGPGVAIVVIPDGERSPRIEVIKR